MRKTIGILMLAGAAMVAMPALAAPPPPPPPPHVQFGLTFGYPPPPVHGPYFSDDECLSTREIVNDIRSLGYRSVRVLDDDGDVLTLRARLGVKRYILQVDDCSGDLVSRRRVY